MMIPITRIGSIILLVAFLAFASDKSQADVFNMGNGRVSILLLPVVFGDNLGETVGQGAGGNGPTFENCGVCIHEYRAGAYEVPVAQYTEFLNAVAKTDTYHLYSDAMRVQAEPTCGCGISRNDVPPYVYTYEPGQGDYPVNYVSWGSAARFMNWLHNGQPKGNQGPTTTEDGTYALNGAESEADLLPQSYGIGGRYFLPWENEWQKAGYYQGGQQYWTYPTSSDTVPNNALNANASNSANYLRPTGPAVGSPQWRTPVGAFQGTRSPCSAFDMAGNVWEWIEDPVTFADATHECDDPISTCKVIRGGAYNTDETRLSHVWRDAFNPAKIRKDIGFRVYAIVGITDGEGITPGNDPGGGLIPLGYNRAVGGVSINADGLLKNATVDQLGELRKQRLRVLSRLSPDIAASTELRKVSLRGIDAAVAECARKRKPLSEAVRYLGGLQRIEYVFVYPDKQDVVLVGPGEGWKVDPRGNVVGIKTGRPVMLLDDLVVALRTARQAAQGGISCSIDPTPEGLTKLRDHAKNLREIGNPLETAAGIEQALGIQQISVNGVPKSSHFANVLVAADYRMKRIAMGFEPAPVKGLPSFLQMVGSSGRGMSNMLPRWWLEPKYEPLLRDEEGVAWELRGAGVKAMTEEDFLTESGDREHTGKASLMAKKWADNMTNKYAELAVAEPIFGELQNCMEVAVVGALLVKERLLDKGHCSLPALLDESSIRIDEYPVPKNVDSKATVLKKGHNWIISASGGVLINSWEIAGKTQRSDAPIKVYKESATNKKSLFWN